MRVWRRVQSMFPTKQIVAVLFVFRSRRTSDRVTVDGCTGWVRHVGGFEEGGKCVFTLDARLSRGSVTAALLDRNKAPLLQLTPQCPTGRIKLEAAERYYLLWEFKNATGKCEVRW